MFIAPILVPVIGPTVDEAAEGADAEGVLGAVEDGLAVEPVWANAEDVKVAAVASTKLRNLLFIGLVELLGTWSRE